MTTKRIRRYANVIFVYSLGTVAALLLLTIFVLFSSRDRSVLLGSEKTLNIDNTARTYRVSEPSGDISKIVIGLHGFGDTSRRFAYYTALHNAVDDSTLVVYPDAVKPSSSDYKTGWNAGFCCGSGWVSKTDDVAFLTQLLAEIKQNYSSPDAQVYVSGFSNGAFMAQRFAAEKPELIDGVAVSSGTIGVTGNQTNPSQPMPILLMHGEQDERVTFNGGSSSNDPEFEWLSFAETTSTWQKINGDNAPTKIITYPTNAHEWDDWRLLNIWHKTPNASHEVARFINSL